MKRIWISLVLSLAVLLSVCPVAAMEAAVNEEPVALSAEASVTALPDPEMLPDSDTLFHIYAQREFECGLGIEHPSRGIAAGNRLDGANKLAYDALKAFVERVADGEEEVTVVTFEPEAEGEGVFGLRWTAEELHEILWDKDNWDDTDHWNPLWESIAVTAFNSAFDWDAVVSALLADCPYDLYWYDKTTGVQLQYGYGVSSKYLEETNSYEFFVYITAIQVDFTTSLDYVEVDAENRYSPYVPDIQKLQATSRAVENAAKIVNDCPSAYDTDEKVLKYYADTVCALADYNWEAAEPDYDYGYGDPWQLIYVFDGDPATKVVCEGYSKALQYLCDLTWQGDDPSVVCHSVYGTMDGGAHMWNVVDISGGRYLVDLTNWDDDEPDKGGDLPLYMRVAAGSNDYRFDGAPSYGYAIPCEGRDDVVYIYDTRIEDLVCDGYPELFEFKMTAVDMQAVYNFFHAVETPSEEDVAKYDMNKDNVLNVLDQQIIYYRITGNK